MDAFAGVLTGNGLPFSTSQWQPIYSAYNPPVTAASSDSQSKGYEARITANLTRNWRLVANYSYTDFIRKNVGAEVAQWYGLKMADAGLRFMEPMRHSRWVDPTVLMLRVASRRGPTHWVVSLWPTHQFSHTPCK